MSSQQVKIVFRLAERPSCHLAKGRLLPPAHCALAILSPTGHFPRHRKILKITTLAS